MVERIAAGFARFIAARDDARLAGLMDGWRRRPLLWGIFLLAPRRVDRDAASGDPALIEIRVRDEAGGAPYRRQLLIGRGRCMVSRSRLGDPDSVVSFEPVAFLRFAAGQESARDLFLARRISVDGSLLLAAELTGLFRRPPTAGRAADDPG